MRIPKGQPALPLDFNLNRGVKEIKGRDGEDYLTFTSHMVTFYEQTYGEHSRFFFGLRDAKLIGAQCPKCKQVLVPAATWRCTECNFIEMEEIELPHKGVLAQTAPITIFPSASFHGDAPFARGYVDIATDAPVASFMAARLRTTTGLERPGIFVQGTALKLVFEDEREGTIRDMFFVPMAEIPEGLRDKEPLLASELDFSTPAAPGVTKTPEKEKNKADALAAMGQLAGNIERSRRAQADLANREHTIAVETGGGTFCIRVSNSRFWVEDGAPANPEYTIVADDPIIFTRWVNDGSLTDAAVEGSMWLPHKEAFQVLPILDRLPRSTRRDLKDAQK